MDNTSHVPTPWFLSSQEITLSLNSTSSQGISESEASLRLQQFGKNTFYTESPRKPLHILLEKFFNPLIGILLATSVLMIFLGEWVDVGVVLFAVFLNAGLGFYQEYRAENTLRALTNYIKDKIRIIRDGREYECDAELLVPGDIIILTYGSRVPADARILQSIGLRVDESILTGESQPIAKTTTSVKESAIVAERTNMVHAGTLIVEGTGKAIVTSIGMATEIGKIARLVTETKTTATPLQKGVRHLSWFIFVLALIVIVALFFVGIHQGVPFFDMLTLSAAVAVGAVPEALPIALTAILSVGTQIIAKKKGIVRNLSSAETLGSTTLIMTDKTGTLTEAVMKLISVLPTSALLDTSRSTSNPDTDFSDENEQELLKQALYNIDVAIRTDGQGASIFEGKPFDRNIAQVAHEYHIPTDIIRHYSEHIIIPFNSTQKFSVAFSGDTYLVMGAPDILIKRSSLDDNQKKIIEETILSMSAAGNRLVALAKIPASSSFIISHHTQDVQNLEFSGILGFHDPIRPQVPAAIASIESKGVRVVMITGDLPGTALSVAKALGWSVQRDHILTGADIVASDDATLLKLIPRIKIFARVTPEDKLRIGKLYQQLGEIVAMTGDGVNDAPALKAVDIGISLGSGSDVAKSAADLVLLDDNFETIAESIHEGRRILANIQKAFMYLMSSGLDEIIVVAGSLIASIPLPLNALQIIWINLFTGSLPAIAFAFDEQLEHTEHPPRFHRQIFTRDVKMIALGIGTITSVLLFILYWLLLQSNIDISTARSIFFVCFTMYVLIIAFSFRSLYQPIYAYRIFSNMRLNLSILLAGVLTIGTITIPFFQKIFEISSFPLKYSWIVVIWFVGNLFIVELAKWYFRTKKIK